uniref:Uncharacterized protein n=1 Tax=Arundo donax TaxID=35708 RepID=A0A0A9AVP2_ARUDO
MFVGRYFFLSIISFVGRYDQPWSISPNIQFQQYRDGWCEFGMSGVLLGMYHGFRLYSNFDCLDTDKMQVVCVTDNQQECLPLISIQFGQGN